MFHQEKFDMALKDLGGWVAQTVGFFLLKSLPRRSKKMWLTVLDKGFWGSFFLDVSSM